MSGRTNADNPDCWIGVDDPKKRKQIQDRLAQRARRKRLAEAKADSGSKDTTLVRRKRKSLPTPASISGFTTTTNSDSIPILPISLNVFTALYQNGQLMGLSCAVVVPSVSQNYGPSIPQSLQPTNLQLLTIHPPWIDRFPFPQFRDNFIGLLEVIDLDEFLADVFERPSFVLRMGGEPWDPDVWRVEEGFKEKWGFLWDEHLFEVGQLEEV